MNIISDLKKKTIWLHKLLQLNWDKCKYRVHKKEYMGIKTFKIMDISKFYKIICTNEKLKKQMCIIISNFDSPNSFTLGLQTYITKHSARYEAKYHNDETLRGTGHEPLLFLKGEETDEEKNYDFNIDEILDGEIKELEDEKLEKILASSIIDDNKHKVKVASWENYGFADRNNYEKGKCFCCGTKIKLYNGTTEFGHIKAKSKGGPYTLDNIRPVCVQCNRGVGGMFTMHMYEYIVTNKMYGLFHLTDKEKALYSMSEENRTKVFEIMNFLFGHLKDKYQIEDTISKLIENMITKEKNFT